MIPNNMKVTVIPAVFIALTLGEVASQVLPKVCGEALVPAIQSGAFSKSERVLLLYVLDQRLFNDIKQSLSSSQTIEYAGITITPKLDWAEARQKKESLLKFYQVDTNVETASRWYNTKLTKENTEAYEACLRAQNPAGLQLYVKEESGSLITISIRFNTATDDTTLRSLKVTAKNGSLENEGEINNQGRSFQHEVVIHRTDVKDALGVIASVTSASATATSALLIPPKPVVKEASFSPPVDATTKAIVDAMDNIDATPGAIVNFKDGPQQNILCYQAPLGFEIVKGSDYLRWVKQWRANMNSGRADDLSTTDRVCYRLSSNGDQNSAGAGVAQIVVKIQSNIPTWKIVDSESYEQ